MKFTKMSLVAALLVGSSAFAIDNVKVSGDANLFYHTTDSVSGKSMFDKDASSADASVNLNVTADLAKNDFVTLSAGAGYTVLTTLGLENSLVSGVWGTSHAATAGTGSTYGSSFSGAKVENANYATEAWMAATVGKTTAKLGRMELDTPLAFTEKWTIEKNTFEGAVLLNQDIPDTTLVAAWVGNGNGTETFGQDINGTVKGNSLAVAGVVNENGQFTTYGTDGAYAFGIVNNSFKPLTVQAWYYDVQRLVSAYWLQADLKCKKIPGLLAGAQYVSAKVDNAVSTAAETNSAYALMLGYEMKDMATVKVAYSDADKKGTLGHVGFNTATDASTAQSKLYTEAWWNYGKVTQKDTKSYNVTVESPVNGLFDLGVYYTNADQGTASGNNDLQEVTVTVAKSYGPADITLAYINADVKTATVGDDETSNAVQVYLTVNF